MSRYVGKNIFIFFISLTLTAPGVGQETNKQAFQHLNRPAQYYLGEKDELLMKINVWGFVQRPGQYLVPSDTDLISLISFVGGPKEEANLKNVKLIRNQGTQEKIIKINVKEFFKNADPSSIPKLMPGDTVLISASKFYWVSKFFEFASRVAVIAQIYWWLTVVR